MKSPHAWSISTGRRRLPRRSPVGCDITRIPAPGGERMRRRKRNWTVRLGPVDSFVKKAAVPLRARGMRVTVDPLLLPVTGEKAPARSPSAGGSTTTRGAVVAQHYSLHPHLSLPPALHHPPCQPECGDRSRRWRCPVAKLQCRSAAAASDRRPFGDHAGPTIRPGRLTYGRIACARGVAVAAAGDHRPFGGHGSSWPYIALRPYHPRRARSGVPLR